MHAYACMPAIYLAQVTLMIGEGLLIEAFGFLRHLPKVNHVPPLLCQVLSAYSDKGRIPLSRGKVPTIYSEYIVVRRFPPSPCPAMSCRNK